MSGFCQASNKSRTDNSVMERFFLHTDHGDIGGAAVLERPREIEPSPIEIFNANSAIHAEGRKLDTPITNPSGEPTPTEWEYEVRHGTVMAETDLMEFLQGKPLPEWYKEAHPEKTKAREFTSVVKVPKAPSPVLSR